MTFYETLRVLFSNVIGLVSSPAGGLVYHLVLLFAFQAAAAIAFGQWRKGVAEGRLFWAATGLFVVRLALLVLALLVAAGIWLELPVIPPLDRAASTLTILLILWAFNFPKPARLADALTAGLTLFILIGLGVSWGLWIQQISLQGAGVTYNGSTQESVWEIAQLVLLFSGGLLLLVRRRAEWLIGLGLVMLLFVVHAFQLLFYLPGNVPGLERLVEIVALPMFTALVYLRSHLPPESPTLPISAPIQLTTPTALSPSAVNSRALLALASISAAGEIDERRQNVTLALAHLFQADLALLILPPNKTGMAPVACCYRVERGEFAVRPDVAIKEFPAFASALEGGQAALLAFDEHEAELRQLVAGIALENIGQGLLAPIARSKDYPQGVIVLLATAARPAWSGDDERLLDALARALAGGLDAVEQMAAMRQEAAVQQSRADQAETQNKVVQDTAEKLMTELAAAQSAVMQLTRQLEAAQRQAATGADRPAQDAQPDEIAALRAQLEQLRRQSEERNRLEVEMEAAQEGVAALQMVQAQLKALSQEADELRVANASLQAERERLGAELKAADARAQQPAPTGHTAKLRLDLEMARMELQQSTAHEQMAAANAIQSQSTAQLRLELELARMELQQADEREAELLERLEKDHEALAHEAQASLDVVQAELGEKEAALRELAAWRQQREAEQAGEGERSQAESQRTAEQQAALAEKAQRLEQAAEQRLQHEAELTAQLARQAAELERARAELQQAVAGVSVKPEVSEEKRDGARYVVPLPAAGQPELLPVTPATLEKMASLAQDLRQPVMSISGYMSLLLGESAGLVGGVQKKFLERIQASCERLEALLNDLTLTTDSAAAQTPLAPTRVDIAQLVEKVLQDSEALVREKGIHLSLDLDENLPALEADPQALHQVFSCLLHNAASATALNGEVGLSIRRETQTPQDGEQTDCIFISVRDSGAGIASEDLPKVLGGRPDAEPIIGLGEVGYELAGLRPLVEAHRGRIWVMSEPGKGSTFNMLLPVSGSSAKPATAEPQAGPPADPPMPEPKPLDFVVLPPD